MGKLINSFIKAEVHPLLKILGYRKRANNFWRETDLFAFVINFQASRWNFEGREEFYINCGVYSLDVAIANGMETDVRKIPMGDLLFDQYNDRQHSITHHDGEDYMSFMITGDDDFSSVGVKVRNELSIVDTVFSSFQSTDGFLQWVLGQKPWTIRYDRLFTYVVGKHKWDLAQRFFNLIKKQRGGSPYWPQFEKQMVEQCEAQGYNIPT